MKSQELKKVNQGLEPQMGLTVPMNTDTIATSGRICLEILTNMPDLRGHNMKSTGVITAEITTPPEDKVTLALVFLQVLKPTT